MKARAASDTLGLTGGTWEKMLHARLTRNTAAHAEPEPTGGLRLAVPTRRPRYLVPPLSWIIRPPARRILLLDTLGARVWALCDGACTVEQIVDTFAAEHGLTFHEGRVAVTSYVKMLVQRGALAVVFPPVGAGR